MLDQAFFCFRVGKMISADDTDPLIAALLGFSGIANLPTGGGAARVQDGIFHSHGPWGYPNSWMVYFMERPIKIRMRTGGTPVTQETSIVLGFYEHF